MTLAGKLRTAALGLAVTSLGACGDSVGVGVRTDLAGRYTYEATDSFGNAVVSGTITIVAIEDSTVTGEWSLTGNATEVGPQVGTGLLEGIVSPEGHVSIELNPNQVDNNVILRWNQGDDSVDTGTWTWSTFRGQEVDGTFTADLIPTED
jgi:hypothetical protein